MLQTVTSSVRGQTADLTSDLWSSSKVSATLWSDEPWTRVSSVVSKQQLSFSINTRTILCICIVTLSATTPQMTECYCGSADALDPNCWITSITMSSGNYRNESEDDDQSITSNVITALCHSVAEFVTVGHAASPLHKQQAVCLSSAGHVFITAVCAELKEHFSSLQFFTEDPVTLSSNWTSVSNRCLDLVSVILFLDLNALQVKREGESSSYTVHRLLLWNSHRKCSVQYLWLSLMQFSHRWHLWWS